MTATCREVLAIAIEQINEQHIARGKAALEACLKTGTDQISQLKCQLEAAQTSINAPTLEALMFVVCNADFGGLL
ncbi:MAG TPA: hypothetical protein DCY89_05480 [Gammaproteobacteria bacterium]|nr:hypothetical protein [Gammaproteobacteria bacterium]